MNPLDTQNIIIGIALIVSVISVCLSLLSYTIKRREPWAQALFNIMERVETSEMRQIRREIIYRFPRNSTTWEIQDIPIKKIEFAIDRWGAEMDMLSLLFFSNQTDNVAFFEIYGDVILRSAFNLAPYVNEKRMERGEQFMLPFQKISLEMVKIWSKRAKKGLYSKSIGIPGSETTEITPAQFARDRHILRFLSANSLKLKIS